ncbi:class I SAM-dependent methyltransferase [Polynucleobacter sp. Latsch14-2]|jgi:SAM-dependent methyltransferase|uniref:methyltransferase domain-containing protein n=1 Tax=Polynucleobacter sp. Latsch14-2 TaxID=2576920 RepID=UPI001C0DE3A5|nr:methyltransferase domain-containing protein [Polynucleobacter sp. Latsch14-2]MBU3614810.1 class I SAM-dependent methyltransferase [Polynucleobacter sp. Latsch14-2]
MHENSKSIFHRLKDARYATRYFVGEGIDIGSGSDPLCEYGEFFPLMKYCRSWDIDDGDAQLMDSIDDSSLDFVHSSHCLEHMVDVHIALSNWMRILKPNGYLVCIVPDEDLYEQGVFPSSFNSDHKHTLTIYKKRSWSNASINIFDLIKNLDYNVAIKKIELLDSTFQYRKLDPASRYDQTMNPIGECAIEFILQKL